MTRLKVALLAALIVPTATVLAQSNFTDAKQIADEIKASLDSNTTNNLIQVQGAEAAKAFPSCIQSTGQSPSSFTLVMEIGSNGRVANTWLNSQSNFANCIRNQMAQNFVFNTNIESFYTSFEYSVQ